MYKSKFTLKSNLNEILLVNCKFKISFLFALKVKLQDLKFNFVTQSSSRFKDKPAIE